MNLILKKEIEKTFLQTIKDLRSDAELEFFLKDILGEIAYVKLVKKLAIAYWLRKKRSYENIKINLEVSTKEISEVEKLMDKKSVKLAIKYLEAEEFANVWSERFKKVLK